MLVLFLNELSTDSLELDLDEARYRALQLLKILQKIRKQQPQLALNSLSPLSSTLVDQRYTLAELLAGNEYKDEWRFIRGFANRSPFATSLDQSVVKQLQEVEYYCEGVNGIGLAWAALLDTAVVSFDTKFRWQTAGIDVVRRELDGMAEVLETTMTVRNLTHEYHLSVHTRWLQDYVFVELTAMQLWQRRETLFPYLRFLLRTEDDLILLGVSGVAYYLVVQRLRELNRDIEQWFATNSEWPNFSSKASPEGITRKQFCKFLDNGELHDFDWHLRFTGSIAGRIHFRICTIERKAIIGYLGKKLDS